MRSLFLLIMFCFPVCRLAAQDTLFQWSLDITNHYSYANARIAPTANGEMLILLCAASKLSAGPTGSFPVLIRMSAKGKVIWAHRLFSTQNDMYTHGLVEAHDGSIYVSGLYDVSIGSLPRPFIMHLSSDGHILWSKVIYEQCVTYKVYPYVLPDNTIVLSATIDENNYDVLLMHFNLAGALLWSKKYEAASGSETSEDVFGGLVVRNDGDMVLAIDAAMPKTTEKRMILCRLNNSGDLQFAGWCGNSNDLFVEDVTGDQQGRIWTMLRFAPKGTKIFAVEDAPGFASVYESRTRNEGVIYRHFLGHHRDAGIIALSSGMNPARTLAGTYVSDAGMREVSFFHSGNDMLRATSAPVFLDGKWWSAGAGKESPDFVTVITQIKKDSFEHCGPEDIQPRDSIDNLMFYTQSFGIKVSPHTVNMGAPAFTDEPIDVTVTENCRKVVLMCMSKFNLGRDTLVCGANQFMLNGPAISYGYKGYWSTGDSSKNIKITQSGLYSLTVFPPPGSFCDTLYDTVRVSFKPKPQYDFTVQPPVVKPGEPVYYSTDSVPGRQATWLFGDGGSAQGFSGVYTYSKNGIFNVRLMLNDSGCYISDSAQVKVYVFSWYMPDAFTPNHDGKNELFGPVGAGIGYYELKVYNRWGEQVFEGKTQPWDGTYKGKACEQGVYYWVLTIKDTDGKTKSSNGVVHLMK